jgi:CO dehydrogenase/acetyl-CoA synthase beta subunit
MMENKKRWLLRLFIFLFSASVSVAVLPIGIVNAYGLFGEVTSSFVTEDKDSEIVNERQIYELKKQVKGINIYNIWFEVWVCIMCMIFVAYMVRLPRGDTIVSLKVRMDD